MKVTQIIRKVNIADSCTHAWGKGEADRHFRVAGVKWYEARRSREDNDHSEETRRSGIQRQESSEETRRSGVKRKESSEETRRSGVKEAEEKCIKYELNEINEETENAWQDRSKELQLIIKRKRMSIFQRNLSLGCITWGRKGGNVPSNVI